FFEKTQLCKYNMETKTETILFEGNSIDHMDWGAKGWIAFQGPEAYLWKVKDDGTQPYKFDIYAPGAPKWDKSGSRIVLSISGNGLGGLYRIDDLGNILDKISIFHSSTLDWSVDGALALSD